MRYFNIKQHMEPTGMFTGERLVSILRLEEIAQEITRKEAIQRPKYPSGNISVDETGKWKWEATNHDTSG